MYHQTHRAAVHYGGNRNRVRAAWFTFGSCFGMAVSFFSSDVSLPALLQPAHARESMQNADSTLEDISTLPNLQEDSSLEWPQQVTVETGPSPQEEDAQQENGAVEDITSDGEDAENADASLEEPDPMRREVIINKGDLLISLLIREGVSASDAHALATAMQPVYPPRKLRAGEKLILQFEQENPDAATRLLALEYQPDDTHTVHVQREGDTSFTAQKVEIELMTKIGYGFATIDTSLSNALNDAGIPQSLLHELTASFSYDVDFQRDLRKGDTFEVMYEEYKTPEGKTIRQGRVIFASLTMGGEAPLTLYSYRNPDGDIEFFNEKGESVRKALLKTPVSGARLSSGFGMRRHPVLGYNKMHKGVDFAAATGTPVYAAGDGVVERANRYGGYGNYLRIRHNGTYKTAYAHLHRFAAGIKAGARVKQGDVVAYIGTTGRSTGPHLHYEVLKNNRQVNPKKLKFPSGHILAGSELKKFSAFKKQVGLYLAHRSDQKEKQLAQQNIDADLKP